MRYMFLLYRDESVPTPSDWIERLGAFASEARERGVYLSGEGLEDIEAATTVRIRDDKVLTTDGPFAETKEVLGGFFLLECKNLDEAIEYAAKIPTATLGSVEVRPVMEF